MTVGKEKLKVLLILDKDLNDRLEKAVAKIPDCSRSRYVREVLRAHFGVKK